MEFAELLVVGNGFFDWINNLTSDADSTVKTILALVGTVVGVMIIVKNPTVGRSILGIVVGGMIIALPYIIPGMGNMFSNEIESSAPMMQEVVLEELPGDTTADSTN